MADEIAPTVDRRDRDIDALLGGEVFSLVASASLPRTISPGQAEALRYAQPRGASSQTTPPGKSYQDLRREFLETPFDRSVPRG